MQITTRTLAQKDQVSIISFKRKFGEVERSSY